LGTIVEQPWNVQNPFIRGDLQTPAVKEEIGLNTVLALADTQTTYQ
jgi:hypothetical protein